MALIECKECGKQISENASACPNCGNPLKQIVEEYLACPKCLSKDLHSEKAGFSGGQAIAGAILTGGVGLLAGTIGSGDVYITCLKCGNKFKAGEAFSIKNSTEDGIEHRIIEAYKSTGSMLAVTNLYKQETKSSLSESAIKVTEILKNKGIEIKKPNSGCMVIILVLIICTFFTLFAIY